MRIFCAPRFYFLLTTGVGVSEEDDNLYWGVCIFCIRSISLNLVCIRSVFYYCGHMRSVKFPCQTMH